MSNRLSSQKSNRVKWVPDANLCQVKLFLSEDCPSQVGSTAEDNLQAKTSWMLNSNVVGSDDLPPGFGGKEPSETLKETFIPQIKWKRPPKFILRSDWNVVAGDESKESETQKCREMRVLEAFYPRISAIPPSPTISAELEDCDYDDHKIPLIPVTPIEEEDALDLGSPPCSLPACSNSVTMDPVVTSTQFNVPVESKPIVNEKSLGTSTGMEADVVAAASAAFTAIMKSNEKGGMIDTDLLIKILSDPKMIEKLSKDSVSSMISKANPMSESKSQLSVFNKPLDNSSNMHSNVQKMQPAWHTLPSQGMQVPTAPLSSANPHSLASPRQADGCSSSTFSTSPHSQFEAPIQSLSMSSLEPHTLLSRKPEDVHQLLQTILSASQPDRTISKRSVDEDLEPSKRCLPTSSSQFVGSNASQRSDLFMQPDRYMMQNSASLDINSQPSLKTTMPSLKSANPTSVFQGAHIASSTGQTNQSLHQENNFTGSSFQSLSQSPDGLPVTSLSSMKTLPVRDTNYYRSLIQMHGMEEQETQEKYLPQYNSSTSELTAVSGPGDTRLKKQKTCKYFNSSAGCKKGSSCPFQHDAFLKLRDGSMHDAAHSSSKRMKLSRELAGGM